MTKILHIDTATETAVAGIAEEGSVLDFFSNEKLKDHAAFVHPAIKELLAKNKISIHELAAVSVTEGPGSYTGLRVGMAAAKGICFALNIPLITLGTLELMAKAMIIQVNKPGFFCPMIDARRMEVFTALYNEQMEVIIGPMPFIIDGIPFRDQSDGPLWFTGSGTAKLPAGCNIIPVYGDNLMKAASVLGFKKWQERNFADVAYSSPAYLKEFYTHKPPGA